MESTAKVTGHHDALDVVLLGEQSFARRAGGLNRYLAALRHALQLRGISVSQVEAAGGSLPMRLIRHWWKAQKSGPADVVDAHFALYAVASVLVGRLRHTPLVVHFQGPWAEESAAAGEQRRWVVWAKRAVERAVYQRAQTVIVLSGAFRQILVERYGVEPWRIRVIPPGVDLDRFCVGDTTRARTKFDLPANVFAVVAVRRLVARMGLDVLLDAWAKVPAPHKMLLIAGEGPERQALQSKIEELGQEHTARLVGPVPDEDLPDLYRAANVTVVPTTALEGFGLVVLESLACGTPVVVSDAGGLPEAVRGLVDTVVPAGDSDALAWRLTAAIDGDRALPNLEACRLHAEGFTWAGVADQTVDVYREAIDPPAERKPRVVFLDHCALLSGGELALLRLLPALDVDAHVVLAEDGPLAARFRETGISVEVLPMAEAGRNLSRDRVAPGGFPIRSGLDSAVYVLRMARRLRRLRPDIVHTNSLKAALYGGLAGRLARVPVVWHVRDRIADDYLPASAIRLVGAALRRLPSAVIANSQATLDTLRPGGVAVSVVPSPTVVHDATLSPGSVARRTGLASDESLRVGIVGRLAPWKGQHVFLDAFARAFPDGDEQAVVVGSAMFGEGDYEGKIADRIARMGLAKRVEMRGFRDDVAAEMARLDVVVHASTIPEPFGQVVIEAMAAGVPVVAVGAGGPAEVITDGVDGLLYPMGDVGALAERLRLLADEPELRERLAAAGRRRVEDFTPELVAAKVMAVYEGVLGHPGRVRTTTHRRSGRARRRQ